MSPAWDTLNDNEKALSARQMGALAAQLGYVAERTRLHAATGLFQPRSAWCGRDARCGSDSTCDCLGPAGRYLRFNPSGSQVLL